jgi:DNA repair protein RecO (recombination protein O)
MTALTTTEAIVLRAMKYRDTSRIVTFYTEAFGKLRGIAKGARGPKNKFASALEPLSCVTLVLYHHEQRELHLIAQCDIHFPARNIRNDLRRMAAALACLELLDQVTHDTEQNGDLFSLSQQVVRMIDATASDPEVFLFAYKVRLAGLLGFTPAFDVCEGCGEPMPADGESEIAFDVSRGAVTCLRCASRSGPAGGTGRRRLSRACLEGLILLAGAGWEPVERMRLTPEAGNEVRELLRLYLQYHVEHLRPLRAERLLLNDE